MSANLIDMQYSVPESSSGDLAGLSAHLVQLVGEPFRFAQVSYGDELTLHFGDLRPARSPKLKGELYGAYILGMRASRWLLKSQTGIVTDSARGVPITKEELESKQFIKAQSRVMAAEPFPVEPADRIGLSLRLSDGSTVLVVPGEADPDTESASELPELSDWELLSPYGFLQVGPGPKWSFDLLKGLAASSVRERQRLIDVEPPVNPQSGRRVE